MHIYEAWFGHASNMDSENCVFVVGLRSIQCVIIKHLLAAARMKYAKYWNYGDCLHTYEEWFGLD